MSAEPLVDEAYTDAFNRRREIAPEVRDAIRGAMGLAPQDPDPGGPAVAVARRGAALESPGELILEDGTELGRVTTVPRAVPFGYHRLRRGSDEQLLLVGPGRCHLPRGLRAWGWAIQLAATRSRQSWGIGDLADLRDLATWSAQRGAGFLAVSPLGAPNPGLQPEASPYYPSTRRFLNPLHLRVEEVVTADGIDDLVAAGRALNAERTIDRGRVLALKMEALDRVWRARRVDRAGLDAYRRRRGRSLERWSAFAALTERFGAGWQSWPNEFRDPDSAAVTAFVADSRDRVDFHAWIQWQLDRQLAAASGPVGVDPGGFDAWDWQEQLAIGASVGAPPDRFNAAGQDWSLPPFIPHALRDAGYRPFIETIRAQLRHAGGLRIDHVLGLFRLWWIPSGSNPAGGAYVRSPTREMLEIVAIESRRARAIVIGEDLGTVPPGVREELARRNVLSTRLALFEEAPPEEYPRGAFAAVTTHDLPTVAGAWSGSDLRDQAAAGVDPHEEGLALLRQRLASSAGVRRNASLDRLLDAIHRRLAASPCVLVAAALEDALRVEERPNLPGTVSTQRENWSLALPSPLDEIVTDRRVLRLVDALQR